MNNINLDMILDTYEDDNNEKYKLVEKEYKNRYKMLGYYQFVHPDLYKNELQVGEIIRYSKNINKLSCASIVTKVITIGNRIDYILLESLVHKGSYWKIYPENYYIFGYDRGVSGLRRRMYRSGISNPYDIKKMISYDNNKRGLDFNILIQSDPTIKEKIIKSDQNKRIKKRKMNITKNSYVEGVDDVIERYEKEHEMKPKKITSDDIMKLIE